MDGRKRARLARLTLYLAREWNSEPACRFDVVAVTFAAGGPPRVEHFPGAFTADGWTG